MVDIIIEIVKQIFHKYYLAVLSGAIVVVGPIIALYKYKKSKSEIDSFIKGNIIRLLSILGVGVLVFIGVTKLLDQYSIESGEETEKPTLTVGQAFTLTPINNYYEVFTDAGKGGFVDTKIGKISYGLNITPIAWLDNMIFIHYSKSKNELYSGFVSNEMFIQDADSIPIVPHIEVDSSAIIVADTSLLYVPSGMQKMVVYGNRSVDILSTGTEYDANYVLVRYNDDVHRTIVGYIEKAKLEMEN